MIRRFVRACALAAWLALPSLAQAQVQQPGSIYDFGDSFQDANYGCASFGTPLHACSNYRNTPMHLGTLSAYTFSLGNDFAVGGTASGPGTTTVDGTPPYPGYTTTYPNAFGQIAEFQALGRRIGGNDLVMLSYAGNDATVYGNPGPALAATVIGNLTTDVRSLIDLGGRNFILLGGVPLDRLPPGAPLATAQALQSYYTPLNAALPAAIAPFESTSLHLRILDVNTLYMRVLDNPASYGFIAGDCNLVAGCPAAPLAVQNQYAFYHSHPSDAFALIIARYIDNLLNVPFQVAAQAELGQQIALAFHDALVWRLDTEHQRPGGADAAAGAPQVGRWAMFASGDFTTASRPDRSAAAGGSGNGGGLTLGGAYWATPNLLLGAAFSYAHSGSTLNGSAGKLSVNAYQFGAFASLSYPHWFVDGVLNGGVNGYAVERAGVVDVLTGNPQGHAVVAGARGGYLFDVGGFQAGPIAGLTYGHAHVGSYSESGDIVLAQAVGSQSLDRLTGAVGLQVRYAGLVAAHAIRSFVNLTAEHDFLGGSRVITTTGLDPTSAVPLYTPVSSGVGTYGRIAVGIEATVWRNFAVGLTGGTTFARRSGDAGQIAVALKAAF